MKKQFALAALVSILGLATQAHAESITGRYSSGPGGPVVLTPSGYVFIGWVDGFRKLTNVPANACIEVFGPIQEDDNGQLSFKYVTKVTRSTLCD